MRIRLTPLLLAGALTSTYSFGSILQMRDLPQGVIPQIDTGRSTISIDANDNIYSQVRQPTSVGIDNSSNLSLPRQNLVGFTINLNLTGFTPSQETAFTNAANAWMGRITGYRGVMTLPSVLINGTATPIDGPGGILGSAGPDFVSIQDEDGVGGGAEFALTTEGSMDFDTADIAALETAGTLGAVIEHEMGHVLGIGTLWNTTGFGAQFANTQAHYTTGSGQYTGPAALAQWQSEFGQTGATFVDVELGGGPGTANGHWNEVDGGAGPTGITQAGTGLDMQFELMTGWLNPGSFVSQMTLGSLNDIGFTVIPEPSAALLAVFGLLIGLRRRR